MKITKWVTPAFDFDLSSTNNPSALKSLKRNLNSTFDNHQRIGQQEVNDFSNQSQVIKRENVVNELTWTDKYAPSSRVDLAVHKKKIEELELWLKLNLNEKKPAPILLLTGPAGVGKTTTLKVLSKELNCQIQEWANPITAAFNMDSAMIEYTKLGGSGYQSQKILFQDFLLRANKYRSLNIFGDDQYKNKLVLVEDYPNTFFQHPSTFHEIVRKYVLTGSKPLVFIISDSTHGNSNERLLFPKDFQDELNIHHISFNPVALTILTKVLTRIANQESTKGTYKFSVPSKMTLESLAMSSNGDVRGAVNALQFFCLKEVANTSSHEYAPTAKLKSYVNKVKNKKPDKNDLEKIKHSVPSIGGKDMSLFLFHALGKILYCKRQNQCETEQPVLPAHLSHHDRCQLVEIPEEVVSKSHMSGDLFSAFLQQNYVNFFERIDDIERASEYLSDADIITVDWATRSAFQDYTISIACRGIMHSNKTIGRSKDSGRQQRMTWRPLHKPEYYSAQKKMKDKYETAQDIFSSKFYQMTFTELFTEVIPYLKLTNTTLCSPGQISFVQGITNFPKFKSRFSCLEKLEEGDLADMESTATSPVKECFVSNNQASVASNKEIFLENEEDELVIEEFED